MTTRISIAVNALGKALEASRPVLEALRDIASYLSFLGQWNESIAARKDLVEKIVQKDGHLLTRRPMKGRTKRRTNQVINGASAMLDASHQQPSPAQPSQILGADGPGSRDRVAMMPRFLFAAIAAVLLLASCYCIYQSLPREPRGLETDRPVHDFEHRSQGELLAAVFPVTNRGTEVIRIRTVLKDCGCSEAVVPKGVLSPGETMTVRVAWDTKGRRGKSTTGVQILYRKESDPLDTQELHLTLTAQIEPEYDIHPSVVEFDLGNGGVQTSELKFTSRSKPDVRLTHAFISHPALHAERATNGTIRITFDPSRWRGEDGPLETALIVMTTSPNEAQYSVPIRCVNQTVSPHFEARSANGSLRNQEASR